MKRVAGVVVVVLLVLGALWWLGYAMVSRWQVAAPSAAVATGPGEAAASVPVEESAPAGSKFVPVDLSEIANASIAAAFNGTPDVPSGEVTLGGVSAMGSEEGGAAGK